MGFIFHYTHNLTTKVYLTEFRPWCASCIAVAENLYPIHRGMITNLHDFLRFKTRVLLHLCFYSKVDPLPRFELIDTEDKLLVSETQIDF